MTLFGANPTPTHPHVDARPAGTPVTATTRTKCDQCVRRRYVTGAGDIRSARWRRTTPDGETRLCAGHDHDQRATDGET